MADETVEVVEAPKQRSYFQGPKLNRYTLDDNVSYIEHKPMDEGVYEMFQDLTSTIKLDREGESTEIDMALGRSRKFLLETLVTSWNLVDGADPIPFSQKKLKELPPHVIGGLVRDIYAKNPILSGDTDEGKDN